MLLQRTVGGRADALVRQLDGEVDLVRVVRACGVALSGRGKSRSGTCPFHPEARRRPGLVIDIRANTWTCPSCAPEGAGVVEFVEKVEGVSRHHAVELLRSGEPVTGKALRRPRGGRGRGVVKVSTVRDLDREFGVDDDAELLDNVVSFYHRALLESPAALEHLRRRGLTAEVVTEFHIGLCNRSLGLRFPKKNRKEGAAVRGRLERLGILRATGHERFRGCVTFPLMDEQGKVVQIYGRKLGERLRAGTRLHEMLHDDRRGVFNLANCTATKTVILTEGILDALTFIAHGHRNVTCCFGTELTTDVRAALAGHGTERVLVAFDRDDEGDTGAKRVAEELAGAGLEVLRVVFPAGQDANDFARQAEDPGEALARVLRHPEWMAGKPNPNSPRGRSSFSPSATTPEMTVPEGDDLVMQLGDLRWRVRGLAGNTTPGSMRLNVMVSREGVGFHVDAFDLYSSRHRAAFTRIASEELCLEEALVKKDLGRILLAAEIAQDELLLRRQHAPVTATPEMTEQDRHAALELLGDPRLLERVVDDLGRCGLEGEATNAAILYLAATSRLLEEPLAVVVQSSSAAGKSSLMEAVLALVPPEHRREFSSMTGQALYYVAPGELKHKVLALAEEEGVARATYALKLLQSEKRLTIASTSKDTMTGRLVAREYVVEGPVAIMMTTTSLDLDPELDNRCIIVAVDESPEQTARIHARQRAAVTLDGLLARQERDRARKLHQDAQRLLLPMHVIVPAELDLPFTGHGIRSRRDHRKLLGLVRATTLLHQHQREVHVHVDDEGHELRYLVATPADAAVSRWLFSGLCGNGLADVPPQTRRVLELLMQVAGPESEGATLEQVAERLGLGRTRTWVHLRRLRDLDYVVAGRRAGGPLRFRLLETPATTTQAPAPVRPQTGLRSHPDAPHSPPVAPRSGAGDIEDPQAQDVPAPRERELRESGRPQARRRTKARTRRTSTSSGRRKK